MNRTRNTRAQAQPPQIKPFVSGGVINNFTGTKPNPAGGNIQVPMQEVQPKPEPIVPNSLVTINPIESADEDTKRKWIRKPISKKLKRLRQNRRLRKLLAPKNALMSLNELMGSSISDYTIIPEERGFVAQVFVNNVQYEGRGLSKIQAKNNASEKALRDIIIQKMITTPKAALKGLNINSPGSANEDVEMQDSTEEKDDSTEEVPMLHLASFALHKLFSEWQADGFEIPDFKVFTQGLPELGTEIIPRPAPPPKTQLPENAQSMHPSTLLCMMRPAARYLDLGSDGKSPAIVHRIGIDVDGKQFIGVAKNKKQARKNAAREACNTLFGTNYANDEV